MSQRALASPRWVCNGWPFGFITRSCLIRCPPSTGSSREASPKNMGGIVRSRASLRRSEMESSPTSWLSKEETARSVSPSSWARRFWVQVGSSCFARARAHWITAPGRGKPPSPTSEEQEGRRSSNQHRPSRQACSFLRRVVFHQEKRHVASLHLLNRISHVMIVLGCNSTRCSSARVTGHRSESPVLSRRG
jgi:hypothetical protein